MEFDLLVRKYLRGTLSSEELDRLRDLLERVPEYRTELRQILELRSIIHDDALRLVPPRDLSDGTRESVGARFAGLESILQRDASRIATPGALASTTLSAVGQLFAASAASVGADDTEVALAEEDEPRRRAVILPYRVAGRMLLAASIAIAVAVAPTALTPTLDSDGRAIAGSELALFGPGSSRIDARLDEAGPTTDDIASAPTSARVTNAIEPRTGFVRALAPDNASLIGTRAEIADGASATVDTSSLPALAVANESSMRMIPIDKDNPLSRIPFNTMLGSMQTAYNPAADSMQRRADLSVPTAIAAVAVPGVPDGGRFLSVGVTLGSGNVIDADAPAALMQNSYYFAFNLSSDDRIGVEMGGSTFMQETQVANKRPTGNIFAKQGAGDTTTTSAVRAGEGVPQTSALRMKQDITYGGVFYDRRLEIDRAWDVCVRTTFGAADGALVTGVRAYTAYSPIKNVTLTLGIGGSKLFSLTNKTDDGSTNYGLYYGVETGF